MTKQSEALRLAEYIDHALNDPNDVADAVSAELRRLDAENAMLHQRHHDDNVEYMRVLAQRDQLLEALKRYHNIIAANAVELDCDGAFEQAIAAINAVEK